MTYVQACCLALYSVAEPGPGGPAPTPAALPLVQGLKPASTVSETTGSNITGGPPFTQRPFVCLNQVTWVTGTARAPGESPAPVSLFGLYNS